MFSFVFKQIVNVPSLLFSSNLDVKINLSYLLFNISVNKNNKKYTIKGRYFKVLDSIARSTKHKEHLLSKVDPVTGRNFTEEDFIPFCGVRVYDVTNGETPNSNSLKAEFLADLKIKRRMIARMISVLSANTNLPRLDWEMDSAAVSPFITKSGNNYCIIEKKSKNPKKKIKYTINNLDRLAIITFTTFGLIALAASVIGTGLTVNHIFASYNLYLRIFPVAFAATGTQALLIKGRTSNQIDKVIRFSATVSRMLSGFSFSIKNRLKYIYRDISEIMNSVASYAILLSSIAASFYGSFLMGGFSFYHMATSWSHVVKYSNWLLIVLGATGTWHMISGITAHQPTYSFNERGFGIKFNGEHDQTNLNLKDIFICSDDSANRGMSTVSGNWCTTFLPSLVVSGRAISQPASSRFSMDRRPSLSRRSRVSRPKFSAVSTIITT